MQNRPPFPNPMQVRFRSRAALRPRTLRTAQCTRFLNRVRKFDSCRGALRTSGLVIGRTVCPGCSRPPEPRAAPGLGDFRLGSGGLAELRLRPRGPGDLPGSRVYARSAQVGRVPPRARGLAPQPQTPGISSPDPRPAARSGRDDSRGHEAHPRYWRATGDRTIVGLSSTGWWWRAQWRAAPRFRMVER